MFVAKTISEIREFIQKQKSLGKKISLVPTMGALHQGHVSLFRKAGEVAEIKVASIFVNKTQFNDLKDFEKYPRHVEQDLKILEEAGIDAVFLPSDLEIFPSKLSFKILPTDLTNCLCGAARAGHFDGVALIITKLFNIIEPDFALFGEKDFQQLMIIKKLTEDFNFNVKIQPCDIVREASGLAMSSRNQRLSAAGKIKAAEIFRILNEIKSQPNLLEEKSSEFLKIGFEKIDYLEIRDEESLNLVRNFDKKLRARIFIAVYLEGVRLIDNLAL
jgi:pantoate--beta-alanine ligase